jgi:uncharacterized protein
MSVTVDTNILLYAANEDDPAHVQAAALVRRLGAGPELVYLFWPTLFGFLRISTHSAILPTPLSPEQALSFVDRLARRPHVRCPGEAGGFWDLYKTTDAAYARGSRVSDAHLVTLMRQHGVRTIYSRDRDFRMFDGIEANNPID